jgi:cobalt-precorrin 5A hydrolase
MTTAVIALERFEDEARRLAEAIGGEFLPYAPDVFERAFACYDRIVALMSAGIAVRKCAPLLATKWKDPAVVVVSPDLRFAVPVLGGHHGANDLAREIGTAIGAVPVISTATEALGRPCVEGVAAATGTVIANPPSTLPVNAAMLDGDVPVYMVGGPAIVVASPAVSVLVRGGEYVVGVGCRRGVSAAAVEAAIRSALAEVGIEVEDVLVYATTGKKRDEPGLRDGVAALGGVLLCLPDATLNALTPPSPSRAGLIGLVGVAEPAVLALARRGELVLKKHVYGDVTVAIGR